MKRLLLASHGIGALPSLVGETAGLELVFVPTAAGPDFDTKEWVQADRRQVDALGCGLSTLDLVSATAPEIARALADADGVFVTGGNSFLLLWHARRSGFAEILTERVESGELLYVGTSAGAMLAGPDLAPAGSLDNRRKVPQLESTVALGLVPFTVLPHDDLPEHRAHHDEIVAGHPSVRFVRLADDRAVLVRGDVSEVVESPPLA